MSVGYELSIYLNDWHKIFQYISAYGPYVALWAVLSAVTFFRRQFSCNRSYHEDDDYEEESESNRTGDAKNSNALMLDNNNSTSGENDKTELMAEELLEGAGLHYSGRPILNFATLLWLGFDGYDDGEKEAAMDDLTTEDLLDRICILAKISFFMIWNKRDATEGLQPLSSPLSSSSMCSFPHKNYGCDPLMRNIPPDVHVQIASFLHPRDVVTLSCVSKSYHNITHDSNNTTSAAIWKTLWHRDYAWVVFRWEIGKLALERSNCTLWSYSKDFYFLFDQSHLDYVLAGHNTLNSCLVGIHSNIYNITPFLFSHPGSPDTLMVHSGRDATNFFDDMGHSTNARKLAMSMCVVVNRSAQSENDECGLSPTNYTVIDEEGNFPPRLADGEDNLLKFGRRGPTTRTRNSGVSNGSGTLLQMRTRFMEEREQARIRNMRKYSNDPTILGDEVNTYFDPFRREWRIWYTDTDLRTIYLPSS